MWSFQSLQSKKHMDPSSLLPAMSSYWSHPSFFQNCNSYSIIYCSPLSLITFMMSMMHILPPYCKIQQKTLPLHPLFQQSLIHEVFICFTERTVGGESCNPLCSCHPTDPQVLTPFHT